MSDEALAARMEREHYDRLRERELEAQVVEPDASNAKCMARGHDYTPEHFSPDDPGRESPVCVRCGEPKPGATVLINGYTSDGTDVLLVEHAALAGAGRFELWIDGEPEGLRDAHLFRDGGTRTWSTARGELRLDRRMGGEPSEWLGKKRITPHGATA